MQRIGHAELVGPAFHVYEVETHCLEAQHSLLVVGLLPVWASQQS
ncbi:MAG: hypothetical protein V3R80_08675 [Candidatus Tectomicrobia bacterium]